MNSTMHCELRDCLPPSQYSQGSSRWSRGEFFWLCFLLALVAGPALRGVDFAELETCVQAELKRNHSPGAAVAIVLGDQIIYTKGLGLANVETGTPVQPDMLFRLGSTTKMFTAAALATFAEAGLLKWDAPVSNYVARLHPCLGRLSVHQLLTHTAGFGDEPLGEEQPDEDALGRNLRAMDASFFVAEPDRIFSYSNVGYWLAGFVAEELGHQRYPDVVRERVLAPLGMEGATFRLLEAKSTGRPVAQGYDWANGAFKPLGKPGDNAGTRPAGQLLCSAPLFARFCIAFMNGGKLQGKHALSPALIEKLSAPYVPVPGGNRHYGYGLQIEERDGLRWLSHGGIRPGYGSVMRMCPAKKFAVIVLCNSTGVQLSRVEDKAAELVLGIQPPPSEKRQTQKLTEAEVKRYAGTYANNKSRITLRAKNGQLVGLQGTVIVKTGDNHFVRAKTGSSPEMNFFFVTTPTGEVQYLINRLRAYRPVTGAKESGEGGGL